MLEWFCSSSHRGLATWYNFALVSFLVIAVSLAATIMSSGFSSSDATKEVLEEALQEARHGLEIIGKISGYADVTNDEVITSATPVSVATGGTVNVSSKAFKLNYKLIKVNSHTITYDNILAGTIPDKTFNDIASAMGEAKSRGLIDINPYTDETSPDTTSAFIYWVINLDSDGMIDEGELAIIAIVYADTDRPSTGEHLLIEGILPEGNVLTMERYIPNISNTIIDLGGRIKN